MKENIIELRQKIKPKLTKPVLSDTDAKKHPEKLYQKFVIVTTDNALSNFSFISRKYYISKLLAEVSPNKNKNSTSTYSQTLKYKEEIIKTNIKYCKKFSKKLPIMYWLPKMHKTAPIGARFIVVSKSLLKISKVFKMIFNHVENFQRKSLFYICFRKL